MNLGRKGNLMPMLQDPGLSTLDGVGLCPSFDLDFTQGKMYGHRIAVPVAPTATRASSALFFQNFPRTLANSDSWTELLGNNILRYGNNVGVAPANEIPQRWIGLLIEGADQNVILENTQYAAVNWTLAGGPTVTDDTAVPMYDTRCFKIVNGAAGEDYMFQTALLTGEDYFICFLHQGGVKDDTTLRVAAGVSGSIAGVNSTHESLGNGLNLIWATFTATAANWDIGINVRGNKTVRIALLTCCKISSAATEGGDFPRSPIPSGAVATTRALDAWNMVVASGWDGNAGTFDVECVAPCSEAEAASYLTAVSLHVDGSNYVWFRFHTAANQFEFYVMAAGGARAVRVAINFSRGDILKLRGTWDSQNKIDGTNYMHFYASINNAAWARVGVSAAAVGGAFAGTPTLHVGSYTSTIRFWPGPIRRVRFYPYAIAGAGW